MSPESSGQYDMSENVPWPQLMRQKASMMGIQLSPHQLEQFAFYAQELVKWSRKINLTAIDGPEAIIAKHFLDSLAAAGQIADGDRLLDIGTGAGFPGVPLKLLRPSLALTVIDGSRKKINFVSHLVRTLSLNDILAIQTRSEQLQMDKLHRNAYDVVVSRAMSGLKEFVRQAAAFIKPDGRILAWKGARAEAEINELRHTVDSIEGIEKEGLKINTTDYELPGFEEKRCLVIVRLG